MRESFHRVSQGKLKQLFGLAFTFLFFLTACSPPKTNLRVAIASSMLNPMNEIAENFEEETGHKVEINAASSGKLMAQIINHAPFHIFISANQEFPRKLFEEGFTLSKPQPFFAGYLAFWWKSMEVDISGLDTMILDSRMSKIAIANPDLAPYGTYTRQWLKEKGFWEAVSPKLVYAENIGLVNHFIYSGAVDGAFTSVSSCIDIFENPDLAVDKSGQWRLLSHSVKVPHDIVLLKQSHPDTEAFQSFLFSEKATEIFKHYGYTKP